MNTNACYCIWTILLDSNSNKKNSAAVPASIFNLRQQHSELSLLRAAGLAGRFVGGIQLTEQITLLPTRDFFNPDQLIEGVKEARNKKGKQTNEKKNDLT